MNITPQIQQLKTDLREFIALSETITPGEWEMTGGDKTPVNCGEKHIAMVNYYKSGNEAVDIYGAEHDANAAFIARSRNISPTMAKMLLESLNGLEYISKSPSNEGVDAEETINRILKLWEETK